MQRIIFRQNQISQAISPMFDVGRLVDHVILSTFLKSYVLQRFDRVLAARVNKQTNAALGTFDHHVRCIDLVFDSPRRFRAYAAKAKTPDDVMVCPASGRRLACRTRWIWVGNDFAIWEPLLEH